MADLSNAFNSISREAIVAGLRGTTLEGILPLVQSSYGAPSELFLDADFNSPPISSITGVRQGDPLGPLLFAAGIHPSLAATAAAFPTMLCLAFADDVTFLGGVVECTAAFTHFTSSLRSMGLSHNAGKCAAWSAVRPPEGALLEGVPFCHDGLRVLGSFIGAPDGAAAFIRAHLQAMTTPLSQIATLEPQAASLLLTRCISRLMSYLARTTPHTLLPEEEWSRWGQKLLHTLLDACGVRHPRGDAEEQRVWGQASLPPSLGGLGLADPSVEGRYSYLASFVQAHGLLASLPGPAGAHLSTALNWTEEVDPDPNQLQTWPGECKASLTQEGRDLLAAEMAAPKGQLQHRLAVLVQGGRSAAQVAASRRMELNPICGHTQRLMSLTGYGAGDWLLAIPYMPSLRLDPDLFSFALQFCLGLPLPIPDNCDCTKRDAGFIVHKESTAFSLVDNKKADLAIRDRSSGAVWLGDITITDPISKRDKTARKGRGWAAREAADKKIGLYHGRAEFAGFYPLAVETYGCPCDKVQAFLKHLADRAARLHFNADPSSFQAAKLLHQFRQRWSVALQRAQAVSFLLKMNLAAQKENPALRGPEGVLDPGECFTTLEPGNGSE
ncbi:unnamed protein product [Closterium sp. NIES-54]